MLPDKKKRSYQDIFECIRESLNLRDLELSATSFVSDFETNIRQTFEETFPNVPVKGCYFHYAKAIWSRVKKSGMQKYYSNKSDEPKFGSFVRLMIGLPFLKTEDILKGVKNIRKVSSQLKTKKCRDFATSMLNYIESFWLKLDLNIWNMFKVKTRTNNLAEGYNYALGSKKIISKHPNPYTLISVIKDELNIAEDQALVEVMCKTKKKISVKYKKLRERQDSLMKSYSKGNIELLVYQQTMGNACIHNADFRSDLDPDPYGYGIPGVQDDLDETDSLSDESLNLEKSFDGSELTVFDGS